jgi:hypothetical protein
MFDAPEQIMPTLKPLLLGHPKELNDRFCVLWISL